MRITFLLFLCIVITISCKKEEEIKPTKTGTLKINVIHTWKGKEMIYDSLLYTNAAGNKLMINEVQYFISDINIKSNNEVIYLNKWNDIFYIDKDIPQTLVLNFSEQIPVGNYKSLSFIFGISEEKNKPFMFPNSPEKDMFWPYILGGPNGGYHYLKLNGKWIEKTTNKPQPFNFHLGVGQIYKNNVVHVDSIIGYVQNYFSINLPLNDLIIQENKTTELILEMDIAEWFENPHIFDLDYYGANIMQNQEAMKIGCENGKDVFKIRSFRILP